jgi:hypothetical protein
VLVAFTFALLSSWGWIHLRDLACTMIAHFVTDGVGFLL